MDLRQRFKVRLIEIAVFLVVLGFNLLSQLLE